SLRANSTALPVLSTLAASREYDPGGRSQVWNRSRLVTRPSTKSMPLPGISSKSAAIRDDVLGTPAEKNVPSDKVMQWTLLLVRSTSIRSASVPGLSAIGEAPSIEGAFG